MLSTSKEQNESLSRTLQLMQQEVERTAHSAKVIGMLIIGIFWASGLILSILDGPAY